MSTSRISPEARFNDGISEHRTVEQFHRTENVAFRGFECE